MAEKNHYKLWLKRKQPQLKKISRESSQKQWETEKIFSQKKSVKSQK